MSRWVLIVKTHVFIMFKVKRQINWGSFNLYSLLLNFLTEYFKAALCHYETPILRTFPWK